MHWVVCYDIVDDKKRRKVAETLQNVGTRIQYSVFECELLPGQEIELSKKLQLLINEEEDSIMLFMQCSRCAKQMKSLGRNMIITMPPPVIII